MGSKNLYFSKRIRELRKAKNLTTAEVERALGLSSGSWSRYERTITGPSLLVGQRIADFFGVSLDELVGRPVDMSHVTIVRFKHALERLGAEEFGRAWKIGKKVWDLVSVDDSLKRRRNMGIINTVAELLQQEEAGAHTEVLETSTLSKIPS